MKLLRKIKNKLKSSGKSKQDESKSTFTPTIQFTQLNSNDVSELCTFSERSEKSVDSEMLDAQYTTAERGTTENTHETCSISHDLYSQDFTQNDWESQEEIDTTKRAVLGLTQEFMPIKVNDLDGIKLKANPYFSTVAKFDIPCAIDNKIDRSSEAIKRYFASKKTIQQDINDTPLSDLGVHLRLGKH